MQSRSPISRGSWSSAQPWDRAADAILFEVHEDAVAEHIYVLSGDGDVIEPDPVGDGVIATIGSGGTYALAAATALLENTQLSAREVVERAMRIAGDICIYSNQSIVMEELPAASGDAQPEEGSSKVP